MSRDLIRVMHTLFLPYAREQEGAYQDAPWCPPMDVLRTPDGWLVKFELAGVRAEDIDLEVFGGRMTLRGERRDRTAPEGGVYYQMEIAYCQFERKLELPCDLKRAAITTEYRDGLLLVRIDCSAEREKEPRS
jgi:HSP20 family protein